MNKINTRRMVESAILIAVATILSMFKIVSYPFGGGITLFAMLPIILISYRYGMKWGFFSAFVAAVLQLALAFTGSVTPMPTIWAMLAMLFIDYIVAYTALGFGGLFRNKIKNVTLALVLGVIVAIFARYLAHFFSGIIFYGEYAEWYFGPDSGFNLGTGEFFMSRFSGNGLIVIYSAVCNGILMLGELAITIVGAIVISRIPILSGKMSPGPLASADRAPM